MPIESNVFNSRLQLRYNIGVDDRGNPIMRTKTYSNLNSEATDEVIYDVATAMSALQTNTMEEVHKIQDILLINV